ncbi:hypothetical protein ACFOHW_25940 [Paenibacillus abyssi]
MIGERQALSRTITKRDKIRHAHIKDYALEALKNIAGGLDWERS